MPIIVRAQDDLHLEHLKSLGATEVIPEVLEGSLMLAAQTLTQLGVPVERALEQVREVRAHRYTALRAFYRGESDRLQRISQEKLACVIEQQAYAVGRSLAELDLGRFGVELEALRRHRVRDEAPLPETVVQPEDVLILVGTSEALSAAMHFILDGK